MSTYSQNQPQQAAAGYPPPGTVYPTKAYGAPPAPPPPAGYPMKEGNYGQPPIAPPPVQTKSRGDGFWKGCCAALCCCCLLDACF